MKASRIGILAFLALSCGPAPTSSDVNVMGGWKAGPDDKEPVYYHTAALVTKQHIQNGKAYCSATLIGDRTLLTAAHCVVDDNGRPRFSEVLVQFGQKVGPANATYRVARKVVHPDYRPAETVKPNPSRPPNDIALLQLENKPQAPFRPVGVFQGPVSERDKLVPAGFGVTANGLIDDNSGTLRAVRVGVDDVEEDDFRITSSTFLEGACSGDSGGPAYIEKGGKYFVAGVVSSGAAFLLTCFGDNFYTDVSRYRTWIRNASGNW